LDFNCITKQHHPIFPNAHEGCKLFPKLSGTRLLHVGEANSGFLGATMTDFYHDDPVDEQVVRRSKPKAIFGSALLLLAGGLFLNTTLAANISLNSGGKVEFGQGVSVTTGCSGESAITATPNSSFINAAGAGDFYFNTITVSGIPASCNGVDFTLSVYDSTTSTALPIFATNKSVVRIWNDAGTFKLGTGSVNGASITSSTGAFTVSFTAPVALAGNVSRLTLQSSNHLDYSCALDLVCTPGDTGPGGGTVFYVNATGFSCGPDYTSTGSPTGGLCNYLEFAPPTWSGFTKDPKGPGWTVTNTLTEIGTNSPYSLSQVGLGLYNSNLITAAYGTCATVNVNSGSPSGTGCTSPAAAARAYRGGGLSDWYLPTGAELTLACQYTKGVTPDPTVGCGAKDIPMTKPDGWHRHGPGVYGYQTSSTKPSVGPTRAWILKFENPYESANLGDDGHSVSDQLHTKPFRAF
jgi:hypothetical protein